MKKTEMREVTVIICDECGKEITDLSYSCVVRIGEPDKHFHSAFPAKCDQRADAKWLKEYRQYKVYACNADGNNEWVVAAKSKKEAARLLNLGNYHFKMFGHETGNVEDIQICMAKRGVVFRRKINAHSTDPYIEVVTGAEAA